MKDIKNKITSEVRQIVETEEIYHISVNTSTNEWNEAYECLWTS